MGDMRLGNAPGSLLLQATMPLAGVPYVNGVPVILSWTVPNDGKLHWVLPVVFQKVTLALTGGGIDLNFTAPDGTPVTGVSLIAANGGAGFQAAPYAVRPVLPGSVVTLTQDTAASIGAGIVYAGLFGQ